MIMKTTKPNWRKIIILFLQKTQNCIIYATIVFMNLTRIVKLTRQKLRKKTLCHNHNCISEVESNGEIIDEYMFYTYIGSYKYKKLN